MDSWATDPHRNRIFKLSIVFLVLLFFVAPFTACPQAKAVIAEASKSTSSSSTNEQDYYKPVVRTDYRVVEAVGDIDDGRRRLAPFQLCLLCKCCTASASTCITMPCCFGIDCQLPNKPFGVCAFVPKSCNCNSCASS